VTGSLAQALPAPGWWTRFAPAPTGPLHLGHLVNALWVWGVARAHGGRVLLRIEDHDRGRCRPAYEAGILDDLDWLGLVPDAWSTASFRERPPGGLPGHPARQGDQGGRYAQALARLEAAGAVYPCRCSRADIARDRAALADHTDVDGAEAGEAVAELGYTARCRYAAVPAEETLARRVVLPEDVEAVTDLRLGVRHQRPATQCGDLLARDRHGNWSYQFAVVVDDLAHGIDVVIRGEDLLPSCGRQQQLGRLLGRAHPPRWLHHPLLYRPDGRKLSKALGDTALAARRGDGAAPAVLLGEAAHLAGLWPAGRPLPLDAVPALFA
jgi:glutamyl-tRNA synthetase/glutamyl-Q tRNA(Asp) synthetase